MKKKKIIYLVNHLAFFSSHREKLALSAQREYDVKIFCGTAASKEMEKIAIKKLKKLNLKFYRFKISSSKINLLSEISGILNLIHRIKKTEPDIIHTISPKFNFIGGIISLLLPKSKLTISISGFGHIYYSNFFYKFLYDFFLKVILFLKKPLVIVHNVEAKEKLKNYYNFNKKKIILTHGSGVDLKKYRFSNYKNAKKIILFPARVLFEKGIIELLEASKILNKNFPKWNYWIAGSLNYNSPDNAREKSFLFKNLNYVKFLGHVNNMKKIIGQSSIVCLPSYHEGMPKSLLEAFSVGRAVVTTNIPGCRDIVKNNVNGLLCNLKDHVDLSLKLKKLMVNKKLLIKIGKNNRKIAIKKFDEKIVIKKIIQGYHTL